MHSTRPNILHLAYFTDEDKGDMYCIAGVTFITNGAALTVDDRIR